VAPSVRSTDAELAELLESLSLTVLKLSTYIAKRR
jgi:hypothetical protein